jgi:tetratricopeptide (TPR) repeat protein
MSLKMTMGAVLVVVFAFGFCRVGWAENADINRLAKEGLRAYNTANYGQALTEWQQGLELAKKSRKRQSEANFLGKLGQVYDALGQYDRSLDYYQHALAIHREIKDRLGEGNDLNNLGWVYIHLGQFDLALKQQQQALAIFLEIKNRLGEGSALGNLGLVYWEMGQYDRALEANQKALDIQREIKNRRGEGFVLGNLGVEYFRLGMYDQALEYHQQALALHRETKDRRWEANELCNLGEVYHDLDRDEQSIDYNQQALTLHRQIKARSGVASDLANLGKGYDGLGQYDRALEYYQQALAIHREIKDRIDEGEDLIGLGLLYDDLGRYDQAINALQESLKICQEVGYPEIIWRAQRGLGEVEAKLANYDEAIDHYRQALDTIEGLRAGLENKQSKSAYMKNKLFVYDELIELLRFLHEKDPAKGYDRDGLEIFERKQGRLFLEEMGQSGARNFAGLPEQVKSQETTLEDRLDKLQGDLTKVRSQSPLDQQRLQTLETELEQAGAEFQTLKAEIQSKYPDYYALKYPRPANLEELQTKVLKPGEVLLVYGVMKDKTCLWVIGKEAFRLQTLPIGESDLALKIAAFRRLVLKIKDEGEETPQGTGPEERDKLRREMYSLLIPDPVRPALASGHLLYIIPTGPLYSLPFEALETQAPGQPLRYLVEDYAVAYLSSASLLKTLRESQDRKQTQSPYPLLAFANPRYGNDPDAKGGDGSPRGLQTKAYREIMRGGFPELPETEDEARTIKEILKAPEQSNPLQVQEAASRSTVLNLNQAAKLRDYRYLVFACHGILPGQVDRILQPALVLSHPEEDGYLTMGDVFCLQLNAELVSLSACNTGRGNEIKGEGVMGLTRAFMYAGTPAVSVTLWSIESESAAELDVGMYRNLSRKPGRAEALREIKLAMLHGQKGDGYRHPFFWAPLVVFGDGQ